MKCPDCFRPMEETTHHFGEGLYALAWQCDYWTSHGEVYECENGCVSLVMNPQEHFHYIEDVIGSGRWICYPEGESTWTSARST